MVRRVVNEVWFLHMRDLSYGGCRLRMNPGFTAVGVLRREEFEPVGFCADGERRRRCDAGSEGGDEPGDCGGGVGAAARPAARREWRR